MVGSNILMYHLAKIPVGKCKIIINTTVTSGVLSIEETNGGTVLGTISASGNTIIEYTSTSSNGIRFGRSSGTVDITINSFYIYPLSGLVAAYNMKPNGLTLTDISGNGYNGTLGDNIVSNQDGLMANGSINGLLIRDGAIITTDDHSIVGRIKLNTLMSGDGVLFTNDNTTANTIVDSIGISNGQLGWNYDPSGTYKNGSTKTLAVGRWYDFALTLSGGRTGTVKLYIDGVEDTITTTGYYRSGTDVKLFNRSGGSVPFYGECSDFRVYNRALSLQEIKDYHNSFAKQPYLVEDFSDVPADGTSIVPREWIKTSGSFKGGEISLAMGELVTSFSTAGITGVSATGYTHAYIGGSGTKNVAVMSGALGFIGTKGGRYIAKFTLTINSGSASSPIVIGGAGAVTTAISEGSNTWNIYGSNGINGVYITINSTTDCDYTISDFSITEIPPLPTCLSSTSPSPRDS